MNPRFTIRFLKKHGRYGQNDFNNLAVDLGKFPSVDTFTKLLYNLDLDKIAINQDFNVKGIQKMKNYVIGTLIVALLVLSSIIYKDKKIVGAGFPIQEETKARAHDIDVPFYLYIFFSKTNCSSCLEIIHTLNSLPPQFIVSGFVPENELNDEKDLRLVSGAVFPLLGFDTCPKYLPWYTPTILGVSPNGKILFTLPAIPNQKDYLEKFLNELYSKLYPSFLEEKLTK